MKIATDHELSTIRHAKACIEAISKRVKGKRVVLVTGKYRDRIAHLDGATIGSRGEVLYLCMVERKDGTGILNSDVESRLYRPAQDFLEL